MDELEKNRPVPQGFVADLSLMSDVKKLAADVKEKFLGCVGLFQMVGWSVAWLVSWLVGWWVIFNTRLKDRLNMHSNDFGNLCT